MSRTLVPDGITSASVSQCSFLFPAVVAMDRSETRTDLELHVLRFLLCATPGACEHPGLVPNFFFSAVTFLFKICPVTCFIGKLPVDEDLASLILFTPFPMLGKLFFGVWVVRHLLFKDCINNLFLLQLWSSCSTQLWQVDAR